MTVFRSRQLGCKTVLRVLDRRHGSHGHVQVGEQPRLSGGTMLQRPPVPSLRLAATIATSESDSESEPESRVAVTVNASWWHLGSAQAEPAAATVTAAAAGD